MSSLFHFCHLFSFISSKYLLFVSLTISLSASYWLLIIAYLHNAICHTPLTYTKLKLTMCSYQPHRNLNLSNLQLVTHFHRAGHIWSDLFVLFYKEYHISWGRSELTDRNVELYPQFFLELITTQLRFYMVSPQLSLLIILTMQSYKFYLFDLIRAQFHSAAYR